MPERHVTYIRDSDRTRVVFVFGADPAGFKAPKGFRHADECDFDDSREFSIPSDGDDYGNEPTPEQREAWSPAFLNAMGRS